MAPRATVVEQWSALSVGELAARVRKVVKDHNSVSDEAWSQVRDDQVLSAKVRGALSRLAADVRGSRDEAMWMLWISQARAALAQKTEPVAPERSVVERPDHDAESEREVAALLDVALTVSARPASTAAPSPAPQILFHAPGS